MELAARKRNARRRWTEERRQRLSGGSGDALAQEASLHLLDSGWIAGGCQVALYAALPDELPTRPLFELLRARGHCTLFPRPLAGRRLAFAAIEDWAELRPGRYGVREPDPALPTTALGRSDVVVVPGVAFDAQGRRLGRGGGFYDRTFEAGRGPRLVGWAASFQVVDEVPAGLHDRRVDAVVTELGWLGAPGKDRLGAGARAGGEPGEQGEPDGAA